MKCPVQPELSCQNYKGVDIYRIIDDAGRTVATGLTEKNAVDIVQAINSYEKLEKACQNIKTYLEVEIKGKLEYIELMKKVSDTDEFYDAAKTNIMETERQLDDYNRIYNNVKEAGEQK